MPSGEVLSHDRYTRLESIRRDQAAIDAANRYDPNAPTTTAQTQFDAQRSQYRSPSTGQVVSQDAYFREWNDLHREASQRSASNWDRIRQQSLDPDLPSGVTVDMLPDHSGGFSAGPISQGGAITPSSQRGLSAAPGLRNANPGRMANPRIPIPRVSPGTLARGAADFGIGLAGEALIDSFWDRVAPDREERYRARTQDPRSARPSNSEVSAAVGSFGLGGIGLSLTGAAVAGRYLLPDDTDWGNPNGVLGRALGWNEDYPNQLDPDALTHGLMLEDATPESGGVGSVAGAIYGLFGSGASGTVNGSPQMLGPILNERIEPRPLWTGSIDYYQVWDVPNLPPPSTYAVFLGRNSMGSTYSWARVDGGTDPAYQPEQPPTYAPNPSRSSRQPTTPGVAPNLLPAPPVPSPAYQPGGDLPWPQTQPQVPPDTQPLAPPQDAPSFSPTPTEVPSTPTNPNAPPGPPDLDPNAPPRDAPNLADDPDTPTRPAGSPGDAFTESPTEGPQTWPRITKLRDGTEIIEQENGDRQIRWPYGREDVTRQLFSPPVLPVPIPVGARWPANTPSSPNLVNNPADNPNVRRVEQPVRQTPTEGPKGSCFYEFQRVADIQAKATDTNTKANNPVSGFPGLYGIGIESRVKLGETFTLLQTVNNFMRTAWRATRMDKVLNVLTFIGVMHNVSMLSRDVGDTFFQLISQALQAAGIRNEEDQVIDVGEVVGDTVENFLKGVLGEERYHGINEAWNKANRIISSASAIIWTVRSIADSSLDLMEWIGENTGRIPNR